MKMTETVSVSLSAPAFSFLLYENIRSNFEQEGFILGEIIQKETKTITDHDQTQINISKVIKVNSIVPCPQTCYFYDNVGRIDTNVISRMLGNQMSKVVAWYKFKHANSFRFSFREKIVHKQLSELFLNQCDDLFTVCLLIAESSDNLSTHIYSQTFLRFNNNSLVYDQIPLHIVNLSDPNNTYKSAEPCSETFSRIVTALKIDPQKTQGLTVISKIQSALLKHIDTVIGELAEAEKRMHELECEVLKMQQTIRVQKCQGITIDEEKSEKLINSLDQIINGSEDIESISPAEVNVVSGRKNSVRGRGRASVPKNIKKRNSPTKSTTESETETRASRKKV